MANEAARGDPKGETMAGRSPMIRVTVDIREDDDKYLVDAFVAMIDGMDSFDAIRLAR